MEQDKEEAAERQAAEKKLKEGGEKSEQSNDEL